MIRLFCFFLSWDREYRGIRPWIRLGRFEIGYIRYPEIRTDDDYNIRSS